jgi:hypothetical protein
MECNGDLVLSSGHLFLWSSSTAYSGSVLQMQKDGNAVVYSPGHIARWETGTAGHPGSILALQDDGNLVVIAPGNRPIWATNTIGASSGNSGARSRSSSTDPEGGDIALLQRQIASEYCVLAAEAIKMPALIASPAGSVTLDMLSSDYSQTCKGGKFSLAPRGLRNLMAEWLAGYTKDKAGDLVFEKHIEAALRRLGVYSKANANAVGNVWNDFVWDSIKNVDAAWKNCAYADLRTAARRCPSATPLVDLLLGIRV